MRRKKERSKQGQTNNMYMYVVIHNWLLVLHECLMHVSCLVTSNKYVYIMYVRVCAGRDN